MANKRITDVDIVTTLDSDESFFINKNNTIRQISKNNIVVGVSNGGTGATTVSGARNALGLGNTEGALPVANGGTGTTTITGIRNMLGLGNTEGALPIANGGTGATTESQARLNLGAVSMNTIEVTLDVNGWSDNKQTVDASGITEDNTVIVSPNPSSHIVYSECGIYCESQSSGKLTFVCDSLPEDNIAVNVVIFF